MNFFHRCKHIAQPDHAKGYVCGKCGKPLFGPNLTLLGEISSRFFTWLTLCVATGIAYICLGWVWARIVWCWERLAVAQRAEDTLLWLQAHPVLLALVICTGCAVIGTIMSFLLQDYSRKDK